MVWLYYLVLLFVSTVGLLLAIIGLPGIWLIVAATGIYALLTAGAYAGLKTLVALILLGIAAEVLETALGGVAAGKAGASKRGVLGAILGGMAGAILGTPLIPIPIIGTIVGACIGSFVGAFAVELLWLKRTAKDSAKIGTGAAAGKLAGIFTKLLFGGAMLILAAFAALPVGNITPPTTLPTTTPTTLPSINIPATQPR